MRKSMAFHTIKRLTTLLKSETDSNLTGPQAGYSLSEPVPESTYVDSWERTTQQRFRTPQGMHLDSRHSHHRALGQVFLLRIAMGAVDEPTAGVIVLSTPVVVVLVMTAFETCDV